MKTDITLAASTNQRHKSFSHMRCSRHVWLFTALACSLVLNLAATPQSRAQESIDLIAQAELEKKLEEQVDRLIDRIKSEVGKLVPPVGNLSSVEVTKLELDKQTKKLSGSIVIKVGHSFGKYKVLWEEYDLKGEVSGSGEFIYNLLTCEVEGVGIEIPLPRLEVPVPPIVRMAFPGLQEALSIDLGSVHIPASMIERIIDGDILAILEVIPNFGLVVREPRNGYGDLEAELITRYGRDISTGVNNFYIASTNFVESVAVDKAAGEAAALIVSGGVTLAQLEKHYASLVATEILNISRWLDERKLVEVDSVNLVRAILNGQSVPVSYDYLMKVEWRPITYESRIWVAGKPFTGWIPVKHGAFYIVLRPSENVAANIPEGADFPRSKDQSMSGTLSAPFLLGLALFAAPPAPVLQDLAAPPAAVLQGPAQKHPQGFIVEIPNSKLNGVSAGDDEVQRGELERDIYRGARPRYFAITNLGTKANQQVIIFSYPNTEWPAKETSKVTEERRYGLEPGTTYFVEAKYIKVIGIGGNAGTTLQVVPLQ